MSFKTFQMFQLSWAESLEICESISGRLAEFHDILTFYKVIRHIQRNGKIHISFGVKSYSLFNTNVVTFSHNLIEYFYGYFFYFAGLTSNFWIGGFYDITVEGWRWESGNVMALGTPFWTIRWVQQLC